MSIILDAKLAPEGEKKIQWAMRNMPLLRGIEEDFKSSKPFDGLKIALSIHFEAKTACLCRVLAAGGAQVHASGSNPLSTQDDIAAAADASGIDVYAIHGVNSTEYYEHLRKVLHFGPDIIIDDGGDLVNLMHNEFTELIPGVLGGCEETTTGIIRLNSMAADGALKFPMIAVNNAMCKHLFDNRYGTGQSVWDGINRTTNLIVAGKYVVVAGYGWCSRGIAMRAKGQGAKVIITEIDPVKALEAMMDGYEVMPMPEAAKLGDIFVSATGCCSVITGEHIMLMKDGAVLSNAGHFNVEVDMAWLEDNCASKYDARPNITGYVLTNGRTVFVLGEGRLVNLAAGDGHPVEIMDMSFAIQALSARYIVENRGKLSPGVYSVPDELDREVAIRKLRSCGISIDSLTDEQDKYLNSWNL
ncbi:MAG: adenosylhomocysteinase [Oscillospiraceae bacterium]|nr:adenosylhomocysteinase [Oscillospiraceae bacterium]